MEVIDISMWRNLDRGGIWLDTVPTSRGMSVLFHRGVYALIDMYRPFSGFECLRNLVGDRFKAIVTYRGARKIVVVPLGLLPPKGWQAKWKQRFGDFASWFEGLTKHSYGGRLYLYPRGKDFLLLGDKEPVPFLQIPENLLPLIAEACAYGIRFTYYQAPHIWAAPFYPLPKSDVVIETKASAVIEARGNGWKVEIRSAIPLPEVEGLKPSHSGAEGTFAAEGFFAGEYSTRGLLLALERATRVAISAIKI